MEDCRAATLLTAIDYAKAFNRMEFQECLKSFARHGASTQIINLIATFLTDRMMSVKVGEAWSRPRRVNGGIPQGSILGVLLFNPLRPIGSKTTHRWFAERKKIFFKFLWFFAFYVQ